MNDLSPTALRARLEALPDRRKAANQADRFENFHRKTAEARRDATAASDGALAAAAVLPDPKYGEVGKRVRKAARRATHLHDKLAASVEEVTSTEVDQSFAGLVEMSRGALELCKKVWRQKIEDRLKGRRELADKLQAGALGVSVAPLRQAIQELDREAQKLPLDGADAQRLTKLLDAFNASVRQLQLDGPVGAFLQALASDDGAALALTRDDAVRAFLDQNNFWSVFRVRLS